MASSIYFHEDDELLNSIKTHDAIVKTYGPKSIIMLNKENVYFIEHGILKIYVINAAGQEKLLWILGDGCIIPTFNSSFYKKVITVSTARLVSVNKKQFFRIVSENNFFDDLLHQIYARYEMLIQGIINTSKTSCEKRFHELISDLHTLLAVHGMQNYRIDEFVSRSDMASLVGTHSTNISKFLQALEEKGVLTRQGWQIFINNINLLPA